MSMNMNVFVKFITNISPEMSIVQRVENFRNEATSKSKVLFWLYFAIVTNFIKSVVLIKVFKCWDLTFGRTLQDMNIISGYDIKGCPIAKNKLN